MFIMFRRWISWSFMTKNKYRIQLLEAVVKVERHRGKLNPKTRSEDSFGAFKGMWQQF